MKRRRFFVAWLALVSLFLGACARPRPVVAQPRRACPYRRSSKKKK